MEAEKARILVKVVEAMDYYERSISGAHENDYINEEALANELAGKFYLARGQEKIARVYLLEGLVHRFGQDTIL